MHSHQTLAFPIFQARPMQAAFAACEHVFRKLREALAAARQQRVISRLPLHLRRDVGDIDYQPPLPRPLDETLRSHHQTLEATWLRQFR